MAQYINSFIQGIMNKDLDERLLPEGVYRNALNIDVDTDDGSNIGVARNQEGNVLIADITTILEQYIEGYDPVDYDIKTIGAVKYEASNLIYWLVNGFRIDDEETGFNGIFEFNELNGVTARVLLTTELSTLNFSRQHIVTGINYINGFLYWTDGLNPPRKINISRCKSYQVNDSRIADDIDVILAPPLNPPNLKLIPKSDIYLEGISQANNMDDKFLYFSYRYKYIDDQYSAMSPFSFAAFRAGVFTLDYGDSGFNKGMINTTNSVNITYNTGGRNVKEIQLLMYDTRSTNVSIIESFNKKKLNLSDNSFSSLEFSNNKTYTVLSQDQITRLFDNVPLKAKAQEFIGNRLVYGNYTQFYDITDSNGDEVSIDLGLDVLPYPSEFPDYNNGLQTWRSDRDYEVAIEYLDKYGRHTTALTSVGNTVYIPPTYSDVSNRLKVSINNMAPHWATGYRILVKQNKGSYYNIFPYIYYKEGSFRWFLINESDRDKIPVGKYIIFKATSSGVTHNNDKYKVLELDVKDAGFIPNAPAGLYFKVKAKNINDLDPNGSVSLFWQKGEGWDSGLYNQGIFNADFLNQFQNVIKSAKSFCENPIYYGNSNGGVLIRGGNGSGTGSLNSGGGINANTVPNDIRYTIVAISASEFKYTSDVNGLGGWINVNIPSFNTDIAIGVIKIKFTGPPVANDIWKINVRGERYAPANYFGGTGLNFDGEVNNLYFNSGNTGWNHGGAAPVKVDTDIKAGDAITINIKEENNPSMTGWSNTWYANNDYVNFEEWFNNEVTDASFYGAIQKTIGSNSVNIGKQGVWFRRGKSLGTTLENGSYNIDRMEQTTLDSDPIFVIFKGQGDPNGPFDGAQANFAHIYAYIQIQRLNNKVICETEAEDNPVDIFHEVSGTYPISEEGYHAVRWKYADYTFSFSTSYSGYTNLGQADPTAEPLPTDMPHNYAVGDIIVAWETDAIPAGEYKILEVPNPYNIVIKLPFPGAGPVTPGYVSYSGFDQDQTNASPAFIILNNANKTVNTAYNAWTFGNGLESYRIKDDFASAELQLSPRVNSTIEDYKQKNSDTAVTYSGIYGANTGVNRLNEFNLSLANFKYLKKEFGSIQKLYARNTDMLVFQEEKISKVLYEKNLLYDSIGGSQVASIPEVLGSQVAYPGEWGISKNPESFGIWADNVYWTDARRGAVLMMEGEQIIPISSYGMKYYFRDYMMEHPNTQKLGCYDPHTHKYVLSMNDLTIKPCDLTLSRYSGWFKDIAINNAFLFTIICDTAWTITVTSGVRIFISNYPESGYGTMDITADIESNTESVRELQVTVNYCTNKTQTFTLSQGLSDKIEIINVSIDDLEWKRP